MVGGQGRLYTVTFHAVAVAVAQEFFYLNPASNKPVFLEALYLANVGGVTDAGDAKEEDWDIEVIRFTATVTASSGGAASTPNPVEPSDTAAGFTARTNDTTLATTTGSTLYMHPDGMNNRIPYQLLPPPEHRLVCFNPGALVVRLVSTPARSVAMSGTAYVRELG